MRLGFALRLYREKIGLSLRDLAAGMNLSASTLSRLERGEDTDSKTLIAVLMWLFSKPSPQEESENSEALIERVNALEASLKAAGIVLHEQQDEE
jgi:transcriptional regulator with XRE-family HTH domain